MDEKKDTKSEEFNQVLDDGIYQLAEFLREINKIQEIAKQITYYPLTNEPYGQIEA